MQNSKKPFNTHLMWEHTTYGIYFVDSADQTVLLKTTDEGVTVSTIDISDNTNSYKIQAGWLDGVDLWLVMCNNPGDDFEVCYIEMDDSDDCNPVGVSAGADANTVIACDIFKIGTDFLVINNEDRGGNNNTVVWDVDTAPFVEKDSVAKPFLSGLYGYGVVIGTDYYTISDMENGVDLDIIQYDHNTASIINEESLPNTYQIPDSHDQRGMSYDGSDILYFVLKQKADTKNYLYEYSFTAGVETEIGEYNIALMLDRNCVGTSGSPWEFEKAFHVTSSYVYQIHRGYSHLFKLQDLGLTGGETIIAITDKYLITSNSDLYKYTESIISLPIARCEYNVYKSPTGDFSYQTSLSTDQLIEIYENDSGTYTKCFSGRAGLPKYNSNSARYEFKCINFGEDDLNRPISKTTSAAGLDETVIALINDNCNYLYADATSVPNIAVSVTYTWEDQKLRDVLYTLAILANGYWFYEPTGYLYFRAYSNMPASGDTFTQVSGDNAPPQLRKLQNQYNTWIIEGGINPTTNKPFTKTLTDAAHILVYGESVWNGRDQFPEARSQAALDAIATGLKNWQGMQDNPDDAISVVLGKYYYPIGRKASYQFTHFAEFATAQDMLIAGTRINFKRKGMIYVYFSTNCVRRR